MNVDLKVEAGGVKLRTPLLPASGTFGMGVELKKIIDYSPLGGIVTKGISLKPREGNPQPRIWEVRCGIVNSIGLQNPGVHEFIRIYGGELEKLKLPVIVNIFGESKKEYCKIAEILSKEKWVSALELNLSCPNVRKGGIEFGGDKRSVREITKAICSCVNVPVWVKLSHSSNILWLVESALSGGARGIVLLNTLPALVIDIKEKKAILGGKRGGFSGPPLKYIALRDVWEVYSHFNCDVIGAGGITSGEDAVEFFLAGAIAVQIGTFSMINPHVFEEARNFIEKYLLQNNIKSPKEMRGKIEC